MTKRREMKKRKGKRYEISIPKGYEIEEILETDDTGYGTENEAPAIREEVKIRIERSAGTRKNI